MNRFEDVATVQTLLNDNMHQLAPLRPIEPDGRIGPVTIGVIESFQERAVGLTRPDGRVDPGGRTIRTLLRGAREISERPLPLVFLPTGARRPISNPTKSYKTGMRRFGARRKKGRLHAGCDLYAPVGTAIYAMDDGELIRDPYAFYLGTYALEVEHPDFVARYGEIGSAAAGLKKGSRVKRGQVIARVGKLTGISMTMLHLELYSGKGKGPLTVRANKPYQRRSDLMDPTPVLDKALPT